MTMSMVDFIRNNPVDNNMTMQQALAETCSIMPMIPTPTANLLMTNIAISQIGQGCGTIGGTNYFC